MFLDKLKQDLSTKILIGLIGLAGINIGYNSVDFVRANSINLKEKTINSVPKKTLQNKEFEIKYYIDQESTIPKVYEIDLFKSKFKYKNLEKDYTKVDYNNSKVKEILNKKYLTENNLKKIEEICHELDMNAQGLMSIIDHETYGLFSPKIENKDTGAKGIIQFLSGLNSLGVTKEELDQMNFNQQLDYAKKYFQMWKKEFKRRNWGEVKYTNPEDIALAIFNPKSLRKEFRNKPIGIKGEKSYTLNSGLDINKDGKITPQEYIHKSLNRGYL